MEKEHLHLNILFKKDFLDKVDLFMELFNLFKITIKQYLVDRYKMVKKLEKEF